MSHLIEWGSNLDTGVVYLIDPHVLIAGACLVGAACIAGALIIWLAVELELRRKK